MRSLEQINYIFQNTKMNQQLSIKQKKLQYEQLIEELRNDYQVVILNHFIQEYQTEEAKLYYEIIKAKIDLYFQKDDVY
ncbi:MULTISPECIES: hypothetical protein [Enterococcus]|uniref:hypothetical protein n=1 Tax=Enterococcus TaxID=1350 RepID=UPI000A34A67E|nr:MULTISPECIES: hypothetical protein [Enterococcus]EME8125192.1 hypothetical protein [Enterococcus faecium]OTO22105.1 hypothetical protein A5816_002777 [Enterococcus sp. 3G1_DIV0629]PEH49710.1 hypothetical protein CRM75_00725 [Enterococcus faecium]